MNIHTFYCDTLEFDVELQNEDGTPFELGENDNLWFAVKKDYSDGTEKILVVQHDTHFKINTTTYENKLPAGIYKFEIGINFADGTVRTLIPNEQDMNANIYVQNKIRGHSYE